MSLELLKEKFGHSGVIKKSDNREQIQERLNAQFNVRGDFKDIKIQQPRPLPFMGVIGNMLGNKLTQKMGVGQGGSTTGGKILDAVGGPLVGIGRKLFGKK